MSKIMRNPRAFGALIATIATAFLLTACGGGGSSGATPGTPTVVGTPVPAYWPPAKITLMGTKVFGANQLPATCVSAYNNPGFPASGVAQCWKDAIANGIVKFVKTSALMVGTASSTRPIIFAYFIGATGKWNILPVYEDDGLLVGSDTSGGLTIEIDWVYGTATGITFHEKVSGLCYEIKWYQPTTTPGISSSVWSTGGISVTCPI